MLSPLRFHYDSETFNLPVRLGLLNANGAQDLIVHILAKSRFELANYPNVTIPTNLEVKDSVRDAYGQFYVSLFDATLAQNPKAVITEYAWQANNCDPCPRDPLKASELMTLGADVVPGLDTKGDDVEWQLPGQFVLTRLHARYSKDSLGEDLVFRTASPIAGGRERRMAKGVEQGSMPDGANNFQARYIIRHAWAGKVDCKEPRYGIWGGPPAGGQQKPAVAKNLAFESRTGNLGAFVAQDVPEIKFAMNMAEPAPEVKPEAANSGDTKVETKAPEAKAPETKATETKATETKAPGAATTSSGCRQDAGGAGWLAPLVVLWAGRRRRSARG